MVKIPLLPTWRDARANGLARMAANSFTVAARTA